MDNSSTKTTLSSKRIAGLVMLVIFVLAFIFSCMTNILGVGRIIVGTFGYMVYPELIILSLICLAVFLGFSYKRSVKASLLLLFSVFGVLLVIQSISSYGALSAVVDANTLKAYISLNYSYFTLLGSLGSLILGLIDLLIGPMGTIIAFVILTTILIGLFVDWNFYGKYEKPHIKKLKTRKLRERVNSSDENQVRGNNPNYSFENENGVSNDEILSEVSEDYSQSSNENFGYNDSDIVGEITDESSEEGNNFSYTSYGGQVYGDDQSAQEQTPNEFSDSSVNPMTSPYPDVYSYDPTEDRRRFMNATFGGSNETVGQTSYQGETYKYNNDNFSYDQPIANLNIEENKTESGSELELHEFDRQKIYNDNFAYSDSSDFDISQTSDASDADDCDESSDSLGDEISKILSKSDDDVAGDVENDYSNSMQSFDFENRAKSDGTILGQSNEGGAEDSDNFTQNNQSGANREYPQTPTYVKPQESQNDYSNLKSDGERDDFKQSSSQFGQPNADTFAAKTNNFGSQNTSGSQNNFGQQSGLQNNQNVGLQREQNIGLQNQQSSGLQSSGLQNGQQYVIPKAAESKPNVDSNIATQKKSLHNMNMGMSGLRYNPPPLSLLATPKPDTGDYTEEQERKSAHLEKVLAAFNIPAKVKNIVRGPKITRYELSVPLGISVKRIPNIENDIAAALAAKTITIRAPIPGSSYVGIELENDTFTTVYERELLESPEFQNFKDPLPIAIGKDISGEIVVKSLAKLVHLLIAGSTGSGKSVFIHNIVMSLIYKSSPDDLRLIMIDPKKVEFNRYNGLPHLLTPEVVMGADKAINALKWAVKEMDRRYSLMSQSGYNNIEPYNRSELVKAGQFEKFPYIVIIVDELAEIMQVNKKEVDACIQRITQLARACGMHMVLATQRPSVDIISGVIKNNVPSRIAFSLQSGIDSKTILNTVGAEKLLGQGDMIFAPTGTSATPRLQASYASDDEIKAVIDYTIKYNQASYDENVDNIINSDNPYDSDNTGAGGGGDGGASKEGVDEYFKTALKFVMQNGGASVSYLQRKLSIGYSRAARIVDQMEEKGYIGGATGAKLRKVLITPEQFKEEFGEDFDSID